MNNWYSRIVGQQTPQQQVIPAQQSGMQFQNPIQKAAYIMRTLTNPAAFVKQQFPDVPDDIANNPNQVVFVDLFYSLFFYLNQFLLYFLLLLFFDHIIFINF